MNDPTLSLAADELSRAAPSEWERFLAAVTKNSHTQSETMVSSPAAMLQVAQGRAQYARDFRKLLSECRTVADQLRKNR